jgi:hypothetical protein
MGHGAKSIQVRRDKFSYFYRVFATLRLAPYALRLAFMTAQRNDAKQLILTWPIEVFTMVMK